MDDNNNPMKEQLQELKNVYSINEFKINAQVYLQIPAASLPPLEVCGFLLIAKNLRQPEKIKVEWLGLAHKNNHSKSVGIWMAQ